MSYLDDQNDDIFKYTGVCVFVRAKELRNWLI